jgi:hypothetical protein
MCKKEFFVFFSQQTSLRNLHIKKGMGTDVLRDGRGVVGQKIADSDENVEIR